MLQSSWFDFSEDLSGYNSNDNSLSTTIVRQAKSNDLSKIGELLTLGFYEFNDWTFWLYPLLKLGICQDLGGRLHQQEKKQNLDNLCLVAVLVHRVGKEIKQNIVGTVELTFRSSVNSYRHDKYAYISNLVVDQTYRRLGIASKLLAKCELIAQEKKYAQIALHVLVSNQIGQEVYLKNGYNIKQVETDLYSLFVTSKRRLFLTKSLT